MVADDQLNERIEAVLRKLPLRRDIDIASRLDAAVSDIAELAAKVKAGLAYHQTPAFGFKEALGQPFGWGTFEDEAWAEPARADALRLVGRSATEAELQGLACGLKTVIEAFDALHMPAIQTLANGGLVREQVRPVLTKTLQDVESALIAGLDHVPEEQVRQPVKQSEQKLMFILAEAYLDLTGRYPRRSRDLKHKKRGSFHAFADDLFEVMGLEPPSDYVVRAACEVVVKKDP